MGGYLISNKWPNCRVLVTDFGNVVGRFNNWKTYQGLAQFCRFSPETIDELIFGGNKTGKTEGFMKFERGLITPKEFYQWVVGELAATDLTYADFYHIWGDIFHPNQNIDGLLTRLKKDVQLFLLSNTDWIRWRFIKELPAVKRFFPHAEQLILSFQEIRATKPDIKIYREAMRRSGANPEEIIYIDDVPRFVEAARDLGMTGILYNCAFDPIEVLEEQFSRYGII